MFSATCLLLESIHILGSIHNNAQIKSSSTFKSASRFRFHDGKSRRFAIKCLQQLRIVRNVAEVATDPKCWNHLQQDSAFFRTWIWSRCQNILKNRTQIRSHFLFSAEAGVCMVFTNVIA